MDFAEMKNWMLEEESGQGLSLIHISKASFRM